MGKSRTAARMALGFGLMMFDCIAGEPSTVTGFDYTGRTITVTIDSPIDGSTVLAGPVALAGRVQYDGPPFVDAAFVYAVQVSIDPSVQFGGDCNGDGRVDAADDLDHDGLYGSQRDCDFGALQALEAALPGSQPFATGVVVFGQQLLTLINLDLSGQTRRYFVPAGTDADHNGMPDVVDQTVRQVALGPGSLDDALRGVQFEFEQRGVHDKSVALLLSNGPADGFSTGGDSPLAALVGRGVIVVAYSILNPAGCDAGAPLRLIADTTGGSCIVVSNVTTARPPGIAVQPQRTVHWQGSGFNSAALKPDVDGVYRLTQQFAGGDTAAHLSADDGQAHRTVATVGFFVADSTPDPLHFADQSGVPGTASIISETIWPGGFNVPVPISISGGRYSLNGQSYTNAAGMLAPAQSLTLQLQSSAVGGAQAVATVNAGGVSGRFAVTTIVDQSPDPFLFPEQRLRLPGVTYRSNVITIHGINVATPVAVGGGAEAQYSVNGGPYTRAPGVVSEGDTVQLSNRIPLFGSLAARLGATATLTVGDFAANWRIGLGAGSP